ncbi:MAG: hypothetical protein IPL97_09560 [Niastella sp.]|nr:hypothetical protein [Niastella sp.]
MTTKIFISTFIVLTLASCDNSRTQDKPKQDTPKALQDKNSSYEIISKRSYGDLVESLYNELLDKDKDLKKLENEIKVLNESKGDTTESFGNFDNKNESYYSSAGRHIDQLSDSLLKTKMRTIITNSLTNYNSLVARHNQLLKVIEAKGMTLNDLHTVLKITKTLPLIEKYQRDDLPSTKSLEGYIHKQNEVIKLADTLTKK